MCNHTENLSLAQQEGIKAARTDKCYSAFVKTKQVTKLNLYNTFKTKVLSNKLKQIKGLKTDASHKNSLC